MDDRELAAMRRSYAEADFSEATLAPTWHEQLAAWLAEARDALPEPNAMIVATATPEARPSARTVLLKGLSPAGLVFFTNLGSRKGAELSANPRVALVLPWHPLGRQVTATGAAERLSAEESDAYFASRPRGSQLGAQASPQSSVLPDRAALDAAYAAAAERWPLGTPVPRPEGWGGVRVVPDEVEFWQGRPDRLHDRLRFRREGGGWTVERLAP
jgi:pyridoxamine 5'-phosphate oxidase